jgi:hypothetical protein
MYGLNRFHRQFKSSSFKILSVGGRRRGRRMVDGVNSSMIYDIL